MKRITLLLFSFISLLPQLVFASPIHDHCQATPWSQIDSSLIDPTLVDSTLPADYRPAENAGHINNSQFRINLKSEPPRSAISNCFYEISDITLVNIFFGIDQEGTMTWKQILFDSPNGISIEPVDSTRLGNIIRMQFRFEPHLGQDAMIKGPIEVRSPSGPFFITLFDDNNNFNITSASILTSGNHYYMSEHVPEPSTILLLLAAIPIFLDRRARRYKK